MKYAGKKGLVVVDGRDSFPSLFSREELRLIKTSLENESRRIDEDLKWRKIDFPDSELFALSKKQNDIKEMIKLLSYWVG